MSYSNQRAVSDGTLVLLPLSIDFLDKTEISVFLDGVPVYNPANWIWATDTSIQFISPVPLGVEALVKRATDLSEIRHALTLGAQFTNETMDENFKQSLHIAQESKEGLGLTDVFNDLDMHQYKVRNLGQGVLSTDAVTLGQALTIVADSPDILRTLRIPGTEAAIDPLPAAATRANKVLGFDALGNPVGVLPGTGSASELALQMLNSTDPALGASLLTFLGGNKLSTLLDGTDPMLGASQLAYRRDTSTLPGFLGDVLRMDSVRLLECIPKSQWAAIKAGTSVYDATAVVQALVVKCASEGRSIVHDEGTVKLDFVELLDGLRGFFGNGTIKTNNLLTNTSLGVILCRGSFWGPFTGVSNCYLGGLTIDVAGGAKRGLMLGNYRDSVIDGIKVKNNDLVSTSSGIRLNWDCTDVSIVNCRVTLPTVTDANTQAAYGIHCVSSDEAYSGWGTGNIIPATHPNLRISIHDNHVSGGTHGISMTGAGDYQISGNYLEYSAHRNIHLINSPRGMVFHNFCLEAGSAAIIAGYGCTGTAILGNYCYSNQPGGEGAIECYVWARDMTIMYNRIRTGANFGIYLAIDVASCGVGFNRIDMAVTKIAGIAVESEWSGTPSGLFPYSRPNYGAPPPGRALWANGSSSGIIIQSNTIFGATANKCGVYIAQRAQAPVVLVSVIDNWVEDSTLAHSYYFVEGTAGTLAQSGFQGNKTSYQMRGKVFATRGCAHFNSILGNDTTNGDGWYRPTTTLNQPPSFNSEKLDLSTHTVNVNYFAGGKVGRSLLVRLPTGITLVHGIGSLELKDNTSVSTLAGMYMRFECIGVVWVEVSRNF